MPLVTIILAIIILNGIVSAMEAAVLSVPLNRARLLSEKSVAGRYFLKLKEEIHKPLVAIISLSNLITIMGSVFAGVVAVRLFGDKWIGLFAAVLTFVLMIFGEIIPKRLGERYAEKIVLKAALPLWLVSKIFKPIAFIVEKITGKLITPRALSTSEEEITFLARKGLEEGVIEKDESEMIRKVFRLNDVTAADMMTPAPFVFFLDGEKTVGELEREIYEAKYSRIPVYEKNKNNIIGVVHRVSLLTALARDEKDVKIGALARSPLVVPENRLGDDLLREFQKSEQKLAVVANNRGNVAGVVSLEDILEELVGEISEEKEISPRLIKRLARNEFIVHGETQLSLVNHFCNTTIEGQGTLNGYLLSKFGRLPKEGERLDDKNARFIIDKIADSAIERVKLTKS